MNKLNGKLIVATIVAALVPTVSSANPEKREVQEPHWMKAFMEARVAENVDLAKTVSRVIYSESADAPKEEIKAKLAMQNAEKEKAGSEENYGFSVKIWSFFSSVTSWFKTKFSFLFDD